MNGNKLLLVEDSLRDAELFVQHMSRYPQWTVVCALDGRQALRELERYPKFRVVFIDLLMPGMPGADLARRIKERWPAIPIIILSGNEKAAQEAQSSDIGAVCYFLKPVRVEQIAAFMNLLDVTTAVYEKGKNSTFSWRTTLCGMIALIGCAALVVKHDYGTVSVALPLAIGLLFSSDTKAVKMIFELMSKKH